MTPVLLALLLALRATVVDGAITRDAETEQLIARTAAVKLDPGRRDSYRLVVTKSRYRLDVLDGDKLVKVYPVALGLSPEGAKVRSGDHKTPEGTYALIPRHESPGFGTCFYICYPSERDAKAALDGGRIARATYDAIAAAEKNGRRPSEGTALGGLILLHGVKQRDVVGLTTRNWTWGCIAMENADVLELLAVYRATDRPSLTIVP